MSRAYSDVTNRSQLEEFYSKWDGIVNSGKGTDIAGPIHFFDEHAWLKLKKDDENLRVLFTL